MCLGITSRPTKARQISALERRTVTGAESQAFCLKLAVRELDTRINPVKVGEFMIH
jgi:hypothetical protein